MRFIQVVLAIFFVINSSFSAYAQSTPVSVFEVQNTVNDLHSQLNEEQFDALAHFLKIVSVEQNIVATPAGAKKPGFLVMLRETGSNFANSAGKNIRNMPGLVKSTVILGSDFFESRGMGGILFFFGAFAFVVALGFTAGRLASMGIGRLKPHDKDQKTDNLTSQLKVLISRLVADSIGLVVFIFTSIFNREVCFS